jgi:alpha-beta hydrolase superfamily lysophospholipase
MTLEPREESFGIAAQDGAVIPVHRWTVPRTPRAAIIISHGIGEHALRYRPTGRRLAGCGYAVYANDHRGHGMAASSPEDLGDFGEGGFAHLLDDLRQVIWFAVMENPGAPVFLLGHSMGSFAAQLFILDNSPLLAGVALSGGSALDLRMQYVLARPQPDNNRAFEPVRTAFDWLSRDPTVVDRYLEDPLCGFTATDASRRSMWATAPRLRNSAELRRIRPDLPVLMLTGEADPINGSLRYFNALLERYRGAGMCDVTPRVYRGARHEPLNEINRTEVMHDLEAWLEASLLRSGDAARAVEIRPGSYRAFRRTPLRFDA